MGTLAQRGCLGRRGRTVNIQYWGPYCPLLRWLEPSKRYVHVIYPTERWYTFIDDGTVRDVDMEELDTYAQWYSDALERALQEIPPQPTGTQVRMEHPDTNTWIIHATGVD